MTKFSSRDAIDHLFDYNLDVKNRRIHLIGDIDTEMTEKLIKGLTVLSSSDEPITIILNSDGGDVTAGFAIYDAIESCPAHITIKGTGEIQSMAVIVMQAADLRILTPHTTVMTHQMSADVSGNKKSVKNWAKWVEWAENRCNNILAERTGKANTYWEKEHQADVVLTAQQALNLGLIDEIV